MRCTQCKFETRQYQLDTYQLEMRQYQLDAEIKCTYSNLKCLNITTWNVPMLNWNIPNANYHLKENVPLNSILQMQHGTWMMQKRAKTKSLPFGTDTQIKRHAQNKIWSKWIGPAKENGWGSTDWSAKLLMVAEETYVTLVTCMVWSW